ncbi:hypothetical protein U1Q18_017054 [Sarracenia purpurea var. burkii]
MEFGRLPQPKTNVQLGTRSLPFEIDLNETPLSSPRESLTADEALPTAEKDGVFSGDLGGKLCGSCGKGTGVDGDMLWCCGCGRGFHMRCLGTKVDQKCREWKCFKCLLSKRSDRLRSRAGLFDINASPPKEVDGDVSIGDVQISGNGFQARIYEQNVKKALWYLKPWESPVLEGHPGFFWRCWNLVGNSVHNVVLDAFASC